MSRMIVVIDKPNSCIECPCSNFDKQNVCEILVRPIDDETHGLDEKPNWCPLKELPERKEGFGTDTLYIKGKIDGWNYCLSEILGE